MKSELSGLEKVNILKLGGFLPESAVANFYELIGNVDFISK